jgi:5-(carboxyamino)imidazole ribonucleotide synthase
MMLAPGSRIGILGGGQLGRMLAMAAARLGFDVSIYNDAPDGPASRVASESHVGAFDDLDALRDFAASVDLVKVEFENVPAATAAFLASLGPLIRPGPLALATAQDRLLEKRFFNESGVPTVAFAPIAARADLEAAFSALGAGILKTRRNGYDGRGQIRIREASDVGAAFDALGGAPAIYEQLAPFEREASLIAARTADGAFAAFDLCENIHEDGILRRTVCPAMAPADVASRAVEAVRAIAERLDYVGVLCVEFFLMPGGVLLANEMAPRVHNSGHWTEAGAQTCQFEQHIRAVAGWPLGATTRLARVEMENLLGADVGSWRSLAEQSNVRLHLYGKRTMREGRKMGHFTRIWPR